MNCRKARSLMVAVLDGDWLPADTWRAHVESCHACNAELGALRSSFESAVLPYREQGAGLELPADFLGKLNARIDELEGWPVRLRVLRRPLSRLGTAEGRAQLVWGGAVVALTLLFMQGIRIDTYSLAEQGGSSETRVELRLGGGAKVPLITILEDH